MSVDYAKIFSEFTQPCAPGAVLRRVSDIPAQELQWLWPGRIPLGKLTLFAGDPGLGKSFVALDIAAHVTRGEKWPDGEECSGEPGSVIVLSAEDDPADTIRPRLEAAGADLNKVHILQAVRRDKPNGESRLEHFSLETDLVSLQDAVSSLGDVRLVVIDPISAYLGSTDSHVNAKVRSLLSPLAELASGLRVAVLGVTHLNKNTSSALYRATGSIAFVAAARAVWLFAKDPDDPGQRLMLPGKMNLAPDQMGLSYALKEEGPGVVAVVWGEAVRLSADAVLQPEAVEEKSERFEAMDWLRERLSEGPVSQGEIKAGAKAAGIAWRTMRRAKDSLGVTSQKEGFKGGWCWQLPGPEGVQQVSKASSTETWTPSPQLDTFAADDSAKVQATKTGNALGHPEKYIVDREGPGCTCRSCVGHFGTVAGWRAHIVRGRCQSGSDVSKAGEIQ
jgi:putative DNA primase/helicase